MQPRALVFPLMACCGMLLLSASFLASGNLRAASQTGSAAPAPQAASNASARALSDAYPPSIMCWQASNESAAAAYGLDSNLIGAVMLQNSGGDPQA